MRAARRHRAAVSSAAPTAASRARQHGALAILVLLAPLGGCVVEFPSPAPSRDADVVVPAPDAGPSAPCLFDQDRPEGTGCPAGQVCNLKTGRCGPGEPCTRDEDCLICTSAARPADEQLGDLCGHGFAVTSWCDLDHHPDDGVGICTRTRSPCERCVDDADCGRLNDGLALPAGFLEGPLQVRCVDYAEVSGQAPSPESRFCSRPCDPFASDVLPCPNGFLCGGEVRPGFSPDDPQREGRCLQVRYECARTPLFCPAPADDPDSVRQITPPTECPEGGVCETNDRPGATGLCLGECTENADCLEPDRPICNLGNGLCIPGCGTASCADRPEQPQVCHPLTGDCNVTCFDENSASRDTFAEADDYCRQRYEERHGDVYCNLRGRGGSDGRYYKAYHDERSCVVRGCELDADGRTQGECGGPNRFCNAAAPDFPQCEAGCRAEADCAAGWSCRVGEAGQSYSAAECLALEVFDPAVQPVEAHGVCCQAEQ